MKQIRTAFVLAIMLVIFCLVLHGPNAAVDAFIAALIIAALGGVVGELKKKESS